MTPNIPHPKSNHNGTGILQMKPELNASNYYNNTMHVIAEI